MQQLTENEALDLSLALRRTPMDATLRHNLEGVLRLVLDLQAELQEREDAEARAADERQRAANGAFDDTAQAVRAAGSAVTQAESVLEHARQALENATASLARTQAALREGRA